MSAQQSLCFQSGTSNICFVYVPNSATSTQLQNVSANAGLTSQSFLSDLGSSATDFFTSPFGTDVGRTIGGSTGTAIGNRINEIARNVGGLFLG
jgi:hypothetical protein